MTLADFADRHLPGNPNARLAVILLGIVIGMVGMSFAAVPLYQIFCQVTGYGGTTQRAAANGSQIIDRVVTVRFDSNIASGLPWQVKPAHAIEQNIGETSLINFTATNLSDKTVKGQAGFNVTPERAALYFNKIECFCFTEQTLAPGETVEMPVTFFVDPEIDDDPELDTVREITLSYTFYPLN